MACTSVSMAGQRGHKSDCDVNYVTKPNYPIKNVAAQSLSRTLVPIKHRRFEWEAYIRREPSIFSHDKRLPKLKVVSC